MKKVLLTGATGYIGQFAIAPLIASGYAVHPVSSLPIDKGPIDGLHWHQADLLNKTEVMNLIESVRPTHLLHFAWYVEHGKFWSAAENTQWLEASLYLAEQFIKYGGKRAVTAGTCAEYDWTDNEPLTEYKTALNPQTLYGKSKMRLALELEKLSDKLALGFASGRIFFPFGENESPKRLIPSVIRSLLKGEPAKTTHGRQVRDFLYVQDVADAFTALLESEVAGPVNIASGNGVEIREIVAAIAEIIGKPELLEIGALSAPADEPEKIVGDVTRLREEVHFKSRTPLRSGLEKSVDWWKDHL